MSYLSEWMVEYALPEGTVGPLNVTIPHAWGSEVDLRWEGPATYRTRTVLPEAAWLVFEGVSYEAKVFIDNEPAGSHCGIWDAFVIDARKWAGREVEVVVEVVKNGGAKFPVKEVLSGFLPYVYGTFGGIYKPVRVVSSNEEPPICADAATVRVRTEGVEVIVDGKPFHTRGILSWGWYPDIRHQNPSLEVIKREISLARELGFNLIKFCLWLPPHAYLEEMNRQGLRAWIELPLWDPSVGAAGLAEMKDELRRIILQYRHHPNILFWTCGCELSRSVSADFRRELYEMTVKLTGNPLVKDNSGGSEMYGADPLEFGGFYDYHPYCDLPHYPLVIESLRNGPRTPKPILLGEFNDYDAHRDLSRILKGDEYWASDDQRLNDQGVRWQMDLPSVIRKSHWAASSNSDESRDLQNLSWARSSFIRNQVFDWVAMCDDIAGTVLTGWIDTPISSSGVVSDWGQSKGDAEVRQWNENPRFFLIPRRSPPWVHGGNRPGFLDNHCVWTDEVFWRIGVRGELLTREVPWRLLTDSGDLVGEGFISDVARGHRARELGVISIDRLTQGKYRLEIGDGDSRSRRVFAIDRAEPTEFALWSADESARQWFGKSGEGSNFITSELSAEAVSRWRAGQNVLCLIDRGPIVHRPFWRECALWTDQDGWAREFVSNPELQYGLSTDTAMDLAALQNVVGASGAPEVLRVDTRTYEEAVYSAVFIQGDAKLRVTTLRPYGGVGSIPFGLGRNPAGIWILRYWLAFNS